VEALANALKQSLQAWRDVQDACVYYRVRMPLIATAQPAGSKLRTFLQNFGP